MSEPKKRCTPCEENAILSVGDAICHRIQKHDGGLNCHGLVHSVRQKSMTLDEYIAELDRRADAQEKSYVDELRRLFKQ